MFIKRHVSALVFGFGLFGLATSISAAPGMGMGGGNNTDDVVTFSVQLTSLVEYGSGQDWVKYSSRNIGGSNPSNDPGELDLSLFWLTFDAGSERGVGSVCFPETIEMRGAEARQIKHGKVQVVLLFWGKTFDGMDDVTYRLWMTGKLPQDWLPGADGVRTSELLDDWGIGAKNNQADLEPFSCTGEGGFGGQEMLTITGIK